MSSPTPGPAPAASDGKRLFVGIPVAVATANALAGAAETLARRSRDAGVDIRWVAPVNYHVTLKFLGWTREATIGPIRDALIAAAAETPKLTLRVARLGGFPSLEKASVLWAGVEDASGSGALTALAGRIERACEALGFAAERRPFHAHVTLGRLRETRAVRDVVLPLAEQMFGDARVDTVTLYESETKSAGSVYREIHRIAFKTAREAGLGASERQTPAVQLDATKRTGESLGEQVRDQIETDDGWPRGHNHDDQ
ncbi:MAG: RNA 2',3'-cyclic phosphodiesterase [Deltaproteobacteria bacterium]|nr:RNA 2',3'-cyclic phosphodiesterase [Deltaproteobacteria bacterium]MDQ3299495.1 RNA 2',3'-cyclic phosphodiesterase [Myxococcota bacterium]